MLLGIGSARAQTMETIPGRLERNGAGDFVATFELASDRLGLFADKPGQDANFTREALRDLIVERFHYLLRLRSGEEDFAVTTLVLPLPAAGEPLPRTLALTATWHRPELASARVVTNTDSPLHHFAPALVDLTVAKRPAAAAAPTAPAAPAPSFGAAVALGMGQMAFGGFDQLLFVLVFYFSARSARDLVRRLLVFALASSLTLSLVLVGMIPVSGLSTRWLALGIGASLVGVAAGNCLVRSLTAGVWFGLLGAFGLVHGLAWGAALAQLSGLGSPVWPVTLAANLGVQVGLLLVLGVLLVCTAAWWDRAWYRTRIALPVSVALGLVGVFLATTRVRETSALFS